MLTTASGLRVRVRVRVRGLVDHEGDHIEEALGGTRWDLVDAVRCGRLSQ